MESKTNSIPIKSSISSFYNDLVNSYDAKFLEWESQIELSKYFKYYKVANSIRMDIVHEINLHLEFWQDIHKKGIDKLRKFQNTEEIDRMMLKTEKAFNDNLDNFRMNFPISLLMYAIYLKNVRQFPCEANHIFMRYKNSMLADDQSRKIAIYSGHTAVVIIAIERLKLGEIIDTSGSIQRLFGCKKKEFIGKNFSCLFPATVAKSYQLILHEYAKAPGGRLDYKDKSYGKTVEGDLFEVEVRFQLYPFINKDITVVILLKKLSNPKSILIANHDGDIIDYSKSLENKLLSQGININSSKNIQDISPELENVNTAFNAVYFPEDYKNKQASLLEETIPSNQLKSLRTIVRKRTNMPHKIQKTKNMDSLPQGSNFLNIIYKESSSTVQSFFKINLTTDIQNSTKAEPANQITIQDAHRICKNFLRGQTLALNLISTTTLKKGAKLTINIKIKPYVFKEHLYKILTFTLRSRRVSGVNDDKENQVQESSLFMDCVEEFPGENQIKEPKQTESSSPDTKLEVLLKKDTLDDKENVKIISYDFKSPERKREHKRDIFKAKEINNEDKSSAVDSYYRGMRVAKTVKKITKNKGIHSFLKLIIIVFYLVTIGIANLTWINYYMAIKSVKDIEKGISIVNIATLRLQNMINIWQWGLILYEHASITQQYPQFIIEGVKGAIAGECYVSTINNNKLKNYLSLINAKNLLSKSFEKEMDIWMSSGDEDINHQQINSFLANDILVNKYLSISKMEDINQLAKMSQVLYTFNNTANDYLIVSKEIVLETENLLQVIVNDNISNLKFILSLEALALFLLAASLTIVCIIIIQSYQRLFRALTKTHENSVLDRINELQRIKDLLKDDIETKSFIDESLNMYENLQPQQNLKRPKSSYVSTRDKKFFMKGMNLYIIRTTSLGMVFLPILSGLFALFFFNSVAIFRSLEKQNYKVSVLSQASYQGDFFLNAFLYEIVFQNETKMLLLNQTPKEQLLKNLDLFKDINEKLASLFLSEEEEESSDSIIEKVLKNRVCEFLGQEYQSVCDIATQGGKIGLLGMNAHYLQSSIDIINLYHKNPVIGHAKELLGILNSLVAADLGAIKAIYPFLINHVLDRFASLVNKALSDEVFTFVGISIAVGVYMALMHFVCFKRIKSIDLGRRRVLKIIPYQMIQQNRALSFYLIKDFEKEIRAIRNIL